ncbi:MAG: hypothetical protein LC798_06515 [Chloroflexi bacterium]|nr:hypothetical protein [Chloroflexota bacterium]
MASDRSIRRYRRWYATLLRLYPRAYQERFGEPMVQTFTDLARERSHENRNLHGFALGTFAETAAGIIRENMTHMIMENRNYLRWVLITAAVLLVPLLAMVFRIAVPDPGSGTDGVNWGPMDFAIVGVLVLGAGLLYEYATRRARNTAHRAAVGIAAAAGLFLVWANFAVGMMDTEPANLMYVLVLAVALIGASVARFEPREASYAMFGTAAAHAVVAVIGLVAGLGPELRADASLIAAWVASALLFRRASVEPSRVS